MRTENPSAPAPGSAAGVTNPRRRLGFAPPVREGREVGVTPEMLVTPAEQVS
jgi:hypothetical protein